MLAKYMLSYAIVLSSTQEYFLKQVEKVFPAHKGVEALSYAYKTESMNITRRRDKRIVTVRSSQRLPLPLAGRLACGLACDLDFAGAFFFGRSESSESSPFT